MALLHAVPDDAEAATSCAFLREATLSSSYIVIVHTSNEQIAESGRQLVEPGVTYLPLWRPESEDDHFFDGPDRSNAYVAVGREP
jgi:hypothetical protein